MPGFAQLQVEMMNDVAGLRDTCQLAPIWQETNALGLYSGLDILGMPELCVDPILIARRDNHLADHRCPSPFAFTAQRIIIPVHRDFVPFHLTYPIPQ